MRAIDFRVRLFLDENDRERSERAMHFLLHALVCINVEILKAFPGIPPLYRSGVRYWNSRAGKTEWQDILDTFARKLGDCKDLAAWRVAELRRRGIWARCYIRYKLKPVRVGGQGKTISLYHVLVQLPDGRLEDPSRLLGMGADPWAPMLGQRAARRPPHSQAAPRAKTGMSPLAALAMAVTPP